MDDFKIMFGVVKFSAAHFNTARFSAVCYHGCQIVTQVWKATSDLAINFIMNVFM